jgi:O-antigen ligase
MLDRVLRHNADIRLRTYPNSFDRTDRRWLEAALWSGMGVSLGLCYLGDAGYGMLAGMLLFGVLAAFRPDLALLFVPLTAPLFLTPLTLPAGGQQIALPPHELALLVTAAAALPSVLAGYIRDRMASGAGAARGMRRFYRVTARHAPEALLLIAGVAGLCMAGPEPEARADALRAFRWFVAEPLIFLALIRSQALRRAAEPGVDARVQAWRLLVALVIGGAVAAAVGLLQFAGYLLHAQVEPASFAAGAGALGGMRRVTSVYGNPNNLALYLGRVWPLAAVLAYAGFRTENREPRTAQFGSWFLVLGALLCLGGIVVSLSRGAWIGAGAALMVLWLPTARRPLRVHLLTGALVAGAIVVVVGALIFALRGGPLGGSADVRILFWQESLKLIERRPLGVGLDQFFYYHHPAYGRSQIDPSLANTQERYARQPHNLIFEIWLNLGPLGMIAFGWLLANCLRRAYVAPRSPPYANEALLMRGVLAALAAALTHGMVDSFYFWPDIAIALWLLLGVSELIDQERKPQL